MECSRRDVNYAYVAWFGGTRGREEGGEEEMCKEPVRKVVGLELGFVSIGG
jgi:hypothetical protein